MATVTIIPDRVCETKLHTNGYFQGKLTANQTKVAFGFDNSSEDAHYLHVMVSFRADSMADNFKLVCETTWRFILSPKELVGVDSIYKCAECTTDFLKEIIKSTFKFQDSIPLPVTPTLEECELNIITLLNSDFSDGGS